MNERTLLMKLPQREQTEITAHDDCVRIEQQDALGNEPDVVSIPIDDVPRVIKCLQKAFAEANKK